jgi:hypothetical protein
MNVPGDEYEYMTGSIAKTSTASDSPRATSEHNPELAQHDEHSRRTPLTPYRPR